MPVTRSQTAARRHATKVVAKDIASLKRDGRDGRRAKQQPAQKAVRRAPFPDAVRFGLVQESLQHNLYHLIVQAILWNQTRGKMARPVLNDILRIYPTPDALAAAAESDLCGLLYPIGLYQQRARRLIALGQAWQCCPPQPDQLFVARAREYERGPHPDTPGWEIAHLPGVGPYALDSFRIFHRDQLRGVSSGWDVARQASDTFEAEWQRVVPLDKDLRVFLQWAWRRKGYEWDPVTGNKVKISPTG